MIYSSDNLDELGRMFERYWVMTRKSRPEALAHTAKNFARIAQKEFKGKSHGKGEITSMLLARLKGKQAVKVSARAAALVSKRYGLSQLTGGRGFVANKRIKERMARENLSVQALMVAKEIQLREAHRAFTTSAWKFPNIDAKTPSTSGAGYKFGLAKPVNKGLDGDEFHFEFGSQVSKWSAEAAKGITDRRYSGLIDRALALTAEDMQKYIHRKQDEAARSAARTIKRL